MSWEQRNADFCKAQTDAQLTYIEAERRAAELEDENAKLRELVRDYHTFISLVELAQPIGHIVAAHGHPTLSIAALDERYRELGVEVDE